MSLDATSSECSRKKYFDDIGSGSQFWFWFFDLGSDLIFDLGSIFYFLFFWVWMMTQGQFLIFDSGSRFIYVWLSVDDSRSRISSLFFLYNLRSRFNLWLVTRGQKLILIERWFARLWGLNDWFWRLFLLFAFLEILIVKIFYFGKFFVELFFIVKICSIAHLWGLKIVLVCSYWGLKSLCWLFDSRPLIQGRISKWMLT